MTSAQTFGRLAIATSYSAQLAGAVHRSPAWELSWKDFILLNECHFCTTVLVHSRLRNPGVNH